MSRRINDSGMALIKSYEGIKLDAYQDVAGIWTIGYGHIRGVTPGMHISQEEAEQAFSTARALIEELAANVPDEHVREYFLIQAAAMLPQKRSPAPSRTTQKAFAGLTTREREVATLIAQGKSTREIAEALVVSERTVESHVANMMFKLGVHSRSQIAVWAVELGLASPTT